MSYPGSGLLTLVAKDGKVHDSLTGPMLPIGAMTGICRGDADLLTALPPTKKSDKLVEETS